MSKQRVEVYRTGDSFVAYDSLGNRITDRNILEQISFHPMPGFKISYYIEVDNSQEPATIDSININTRI